MNSWSGWSDSNGRSRRPRLRGVDQAVLHPGFLSCLTNGYWKLIQDFFSIFSEMILYSDRAGAGGGTRTRTGLLPADFKSAAATVTPLPHCFMFFLVSFFWNNGAAWRNRTTNLPLTRRLLCLIELRRQACHADFYRYEFSRLLNFI